jgi:transcriptional regulator with XRE-family HTH domain
MAIRDHLLVEIGARIRLAREREGCTQRRLGVMLGIPYQLIQAYEHGEKLTLDRLVTIASCLAVDKRWLLAGGDEARKPLVEPARLGFYGRPAHTTVAFEADAHTKAACGVPADAPNQLAWQCWYNRIHTDDHARVDAELARLNDPRDGVFNMQYRLLGVDGVERCIIDYGLMIFDSAGGPVRLRGLMLDITDEPRTQKTDDKVRRILMTVRPALIALVAMLLTCVGVCEIQGMPCPWLKQFTLVSLF